MNTKFALRRYFWSVLIFLLVACGAPSTEITPTSMTTITSTPAPSLTPLSPTPTIPPVTSTPTSLPVSSTPDGLRMAYIVDGNLYFQEGSNPAVQLTHSGEDWNPIFSDDGEKLVFFRGNDWDELHSINSDGGQEQVLVTSKSLMALNNLSTESTKPLSPIFVPGTHLLLFATQQADMGMWNNDLLVVDTDSAKITRLLPPNQVSDFYVSPDGKFIAIDSVGQIDVIDIEGKIIRRNLLGFTPSEPSFLPPGIFWMSDSRGLIILLPVPTIFEVGDIASYTVWRYLLDGDTGAEISLDPLPMEHYKAEVSPDGNWIIYNREDQNAFYIGDLRTGYTKLYEPKPFIFHYDWSWSSDNEHFVYSATPGSTLYLGSVDGSPELIGEGEFQGWIDPNRFLYYADKNIVMGDIKGSKQIILADHESFKNRGTIFTFILPEALKR